MKNKRPSYEELLTAAKPKVSEVPKKRGRPPAAPRVDVVEQIGNFAMLDIPMDAKQIALVKSGHKQNGLEMAPIRRRFVEEYVSLNERSTKEAAIRCGVEPRLAQARAYDWMRCQDVIDLLREYKAERAKYTICDAVKAFEEMAILGHSDISEFVDISPDGRFAKLRDPKDIPSFAWRAVKKIKCKAFKDKEGRVHAETEIEMHDKKGILQLMAQCLGMMTKNVNVSGKVEWMELISKEQLEPPSPDVLKAQIREQQKVLAAAELQVEYMAEEGR